MRSKRTSELNFWPGIADMVLAASIIFLLLWFVERFRTIELVRGNELLRQENASLRRDKPPIITLDEASGHTFDSGSASLSISFEEALREAIIPNLNTILNDYDVNVIEVIGHTDSQTVSVSQSNLDQELESVVLGRSSIDSLNYGSNADLGLIRAVAVAEFIRLNASGRLRNIHYRFYSAAQLIPPNGRLQDTNREADATRRRIELRFTRLTR